MSKPGQEFLESNKQQMLDFLIKIAAINSGSYNISGLHNVSEILKQELLTLGCEHIKMPVAPQKIINERGQQQELSLGDVLRFWKRPEAPMQVLLVGHIDTVYGLEHKFQIIKKIGGDMLNGPGVSDMKGGLVILLWALKAFEQLPQAANLGWEVILTCDEEIGSPGSAEIIENRAKRHKVGLVFEPAMDDKGTLAGTRKGSGRYTLIMHGKAAHAGRAFNDGRNAICKMSEVIYQINSLNGQRDGVTINIGFVHGGEALNIVPDTCVCKIDIRIPDSESIIWVQNSLTTIQRNFNQQHEQQGYKLDMQGSFDRKPKVLDAKATQLYEIVQQIGKDLGQEINWQPSGGCCDGNNLAAVGLPNVDTLGVRGGRIHSEQEYMLIPSLLERAMLVTNTLVYLSENGFNGT